jgi:hypothetical protein
MPVEPIYVSLRDPPRWSNDWLQFDDGTTVTRDRNALTREDAINQFRQSALRFFNTEYTHLKHQSE